MNRMIGTSIHGARHPETNIGASIIRIGFGSPLYYNHNKEPPLHSGIGNYLGPYSRIVYWAPKLQSLIIKAPVL